MKKLLCVLVLVFILIAVTPVNAQFQQSNEKPKCKDGYTNMGYKPFTCVCESNSDVKQVPKECLVSGFPAGIPSIENSDGTREFSINQYNCYDGWYRNNDREVCIEGAGQSEDSLILPEVFLLSTEKTSYQKNESIVFSGKINGIIENQKTTVNLIILEPSGGILQPKGIFSDGVYENEFEFLIPTILFDEDGIYNATAYVQSVESGKSIIFEYFKNGIEPASDTPDKKLPDCEECTLD